MAEKTSDVINGRSLRWLTCFRRLCLGGRFLSSFSREEMFRKEQSRGGPYWLFDKELLNEASMSVVFESFGIAVLLQFLLNEKTVTIYCSELIAFKPGNPVRVIYLWVLSNRMPLNLLSDLGLLDELGQQFQYSCNKITMTKIQISCQNSNGFFSNISHQMMI